MAKNSIPRKYGISRADAIRQMGAQELYNPNGAIQQELRKHPRTLYYNPFDKKSSDDDGFDYFSNQEIKEKENPSFGTTDWFGKLGSDFQNTGRMLAQRIQENVVDSVGGKLIDLQQEKDDIEKIKRYQALQKYKDDLENSQLKTPLQQIQLDKAKKEIADLDMYFLGEGKSHPVIASHMFDYNKLSTLERAKINLNYLEKDDMQGEWYNPVPYLANGLSFLTNIGGYTYHKIDNLLGRVVGNNTGYNAIAAGGLSRMDINNENDRNTLLRAYKGSNTGAKNINNAQLDYWEKLTNDEINVKKVQLKNSQARLRKGQFNILGLDLNVWDPNKVDKQFEKEQDDFHGSYKDLFGQGPLRYLQHGIVEVGSSVALFSHQLQAMGINGAMAWLAESVPTWAVKLPAGGIKGLAGGIARFATDKAVIGGEKILTNQLRPSLQAAVKGIALGSGLYAARESRIDETGMEAIQGYAERVAQKIYEKHGNFDVIERDIKKYANAAGIDTSKMEADELIKLGLALGVESEDKAYTEAKEESKKGLNKLINANNALALSDYLQTLPFMNYSGAILREYGASIASPKLTAAFEIMRHPKTAKFAEEYIRSLAVKNAPKELLKKYAGDLSGTIGVASDKAFMKALAKKDFVKALRNYEVKDYLTKKAKTAAWEALSEGTEEINQEILQERYKRGDYDNYNTPYNMLNVPEIFANGDMSIQGLYAYMGLPGYDPDFSVENIRKAFNIGALSSGIFSGFLHGLTNVRRSSGNENIRGLMAQLRNDKVVGRMVGDMYGQVQDQAHLETFYNAFKHAGVNRDHLMRSLHMLKEGVEANKDNTLVNKEYVENDMKLLDAAWTMYSDPEINRQLKELGMKKPGFFKHGSPEHKQFVLDGAAAIVEPQKTRELLQKQFELLADHNKEFAGTVDKLLSENTSEQEKEELRTANPKLAETMDKLDSLYTTVLKAATKNKNLQFDAFYQNIKGANNAENNKFFNKALRQHYDKLPIKDEMSFEEYKDMVLSQKNRDFSRTESEFKNVARTAYDFYKNDEVYSALDDETAFATNDHIREAAEKLGLWAPNMFKALRDIYNNKDFIQDGENKNENRDLKDKIVQRAIGLYNAGNLTRDEYIKSRLQRIQNQKSLAAFAGIIEMVKNRAERLKYIRTMTGLDTETNLDGILDELMDQQDGLNRELAAHEENYIDLNGKEFELDNEQEFKALRQKIEMNKALWSTQIQLANAYQFKNVNVNRLRQALYSNHDKLFNNRTLTSEDEELIKQLTGSEKEYNELVQKLTRNEQVSPDESYVEPLSKKEQKQLNKEKEAVAKKAAVAFIKKRTLERLKRNRIANRLYEEENGPVDAPIEAPAGEETDSTEEGSITPATGKEAEFTENEKVLAEEFGGETSTKTKQAEIHKRKREERLQKERKKAENRKAEDRLDSVDEEEGITSGKEEQAGGTDKAGTQTGTATDTTGTSSTTPAAATDNAVTPATHAAAPATTQATTKEEVPITESDDEVPTTEPELIDDIEPESEDGVPEPQPEEDGVDESAIADLENQNGTPDPYEAAYNSNPTEDYIQDGEQGGNVLNPYEAADESNPTDDYVQIEDPQWLEMQEDGIFVYYPDGGKNGIVLTREQSNDIVDDILCGNQRSTAGLHLVDPSNAERKNFYADETESFVSSTLFYNPDPKVNEETGLDEKAILSVDGNPIQLEHEQGSGRELAKKLTQKGWLNNAKKYFVVACAKERREQIEAYIKSQNKPEKDWVNEQWRNGLTVAMVIDDGVKSYVVFYKTLGTLRYVHEKGIHKGKPGINSERKALQHALKHRGLSEEKILKCAKDFGITPERDDKTGKLTTSFIDSVIKALAKDIAKADYLDLYGKQNFDAWFNKKLNLSRPEDEKARSVALATADDKARAKLADKKILTNAKITEQINKLEQRRNEIIDAYLGVPREGETYYDRLVAFGTAPRTNIVPDLVEQSNGKIQNEKDKYGWPALKGLWKIFTGKETATIEEITDMIKKGIMNLGYGLGAFAAEQDRFSIRSVLGGTDHLGGRGLSGKIYTYIEGPNGQSVPIMLVESKFSNWYINEADFIPNRDRTVAAQPQATTPEVILMMLLGEIDFGINDRGLLDSAIEFFIHHGEKTLMKDHKPETESLMLQFARKQISYDSENGELSIWIDNEGLKKYSKDQIMTDKDLRLKIVRAIATQMHWNTDISYMQSLVTLDKNGGFQNSVINTMFKWILNTFGKGRNQFASDEDFLNQRVSMYGCEELSFTVGDFYTMKNGQIKAKEDVSLLAWMIKEKKLVTDLNIEQPFYAPFIFSDGIQNKNEALDVLKSKAATKKETKPEANVEEKSKPEKKKSTKQKEPAKKEEKQDLSSVLEREKTNRSDAVKNMFSLKDDFLFDDSDLAQLAGRDGLQVVQAYAVLAMQDKTNEAESLNNRIDDFMNQPGREKWKLKTKSENNVPHRKKAPYGFNSDSTPNFKEYVKGNAFVLLLVKKDINGNIIVDPQYRTADKFARDHVNKEDNSVRLSGAFSKTHGGHGTLDIEHARNWISSRLGIDKSRINVLNGLLKSMSSGEAYGVTTVISSVLANKVVGMMAFNDQADAGIEYHEAWHYVSLLLSDPKTRRRIYDAYAKAHNFKTGQYKYKEIEEMMADDFMNYVQRAEDKSILGSVKRFFNDVAVFLFASQNKKAYRQMYKDIVDGKYKAVEMDPQSLQEFAKFYQNKVFQIKHGVLGYSKEQVDSYKHIDTAAELYAGAEAFQKRLFTAFDVSTIQKINQLVNKDFNLIIEEFKSFVDEQENDEIADMLSDILNDPLALKEIVVSAFAQLGLRVKITKQKKDKKAANKTEEVDKTDPEKNLKEDEETEPLEDVDLTTADVKLEENKDEEETTATGKEKNPENSWNKFSLQESRKQNASIATKNFLRLIPAYKKEYDDDGNVVWTRLYDRYDTAEYYDFDEAWHTIMDELWMCSSFADMIETEDGKKIYSPTSLLGMVKEKIDVNPFYKGLFEKLKDLNDSTLTSDNFLKSELFGTINGYKQLIQQFVIEKPATSSSSDYEGEMDYIQILFDDSMDSTSSIVDETPRTERRWVLRESNLQETSRALPRKWSRNFVSNGFMVYVDGKTVLDKNAIDSVDKEYKALLNELSGYFKLVKKGKSEETLIDKSLLIDHPEILTNAKQRIVDLLRKLGIESDESSLNIFINMSFKNEGKKIRAEEQLYALKKMLIDSSPGSLSFIFESLRKASKRGLQSFTKETGIGSRYEKQFDDVFNGYKKDSQMGKLAVAWSSIHPQASEFSILDANGNRLYPINQNTFVTTRTRNLNDRTQNFADAMMRSKYCAHSLILQKSSEYVKKGDLSDQLISTTFVGIRDATKAIGGDYFGITPVEEFIAKMILLENDNLIDPTMADKKSWGAFKGGFDLCHDVILPEISSGDMAWALKAVYLQNLSKKQAKELGVSYDPEDEVGSVKAFNEKYEEPFAMAAKWRNELRLAAKKDPKALEYYNNIIDQIQAKAYKKFLSGNNAKNYRRFSENTINRFAGYFLDELDSLIDYYNPKTIASLIKNKNNLSNEFHGKIYKGKDGVERMDFSGNGGRFRYFYDVPIETASGNEFLNLNEKLQQLYEFQKMVMNGEIKSEDAHGDEIYTVLGIQDVIGGKKKPEELTGFELIEKFLADLRAQLIDVNTVTQEYSSDFKEAINSWIMNLVEHEIDAASEETSPLRIIKKDKRGNLNNYAVPQEIIDKYKKKVKDQGFDSKIKGKDEETAVLYSIIANYTVNSMMSIIEFEKVFAGDPAWYKTKNYKEQRKVECEYTSETGKTAKYTVSLDIQKDSFTDKIKRLGSLMSPGQEIRTDFSQEELAADPTLFAKQYVNVDVKDLKYKSLVFDEIERQFKTQLLEDAIRMEYGNTKNIFADFMEELTNTNKKNLEKKKANPNANVRIYSPKEVVDAEHAFSALHHDYSFVERLWEKLDDDIRIPLEKTLAGQINPYNRITVSDAQVIIRPETYRKIRIGLGQWSDEIEDAYNLIEGYKYNEDGVRVKKTKEELEKENAEGSWMQNKEKYEAAKKLQAYALKVAYFQNKPETIKIGDNETIQITKPRLGKQAMFPLFSYMRSSEVGKQLYDRMNAEGNEIDTISFESAIKVGGAQYAPTIADKTDINKLSDLFAVTYDKNGKAIAKHVNQQSINYTTGKVISQDNIKGAIATQIQDFEMLRWQLNTEAHTHDTRNIGSQMFKIAFSNLIDSIDYGHGKDKISGRNIKRNVMAYVDSLTQIGAVELLNSFYTKDENGEDVVDAKKVKKWLFGLAESNGIGPAGLELLKRGACAESLVSRSVFENAVIKEVNKHVVDITTKGGTAVQQSMFGFAGYSNVATLAEEGVNSYNGNRELKWNSDNNTMQMMLSANFFKAVIPKDVWNQGYKAQRDYLIEKNLICGDRKDSESSVVKPFGIGYRIPTQGMSSMFAIQVADILPETTGDLIIVPREFTAQTGSDFDVDKLFLATLSFKDGVEDTLESTGLEKLNITDKGAMREFIYATRENKKEEELPAQEEQQEEDDTKNTSTDKRSVLEKLKSIIGNQLLHTYITVITDEHNFSQARASIDTVTGHLLDDLVNPVLRNSATRYQTGGLELTPSFQVLRKMEFSVGKDGIGPFALNITNLSFTQLTGLTIDAGFYNKLFNLKDLTQITGEDGVRISDWLSAMVNAHVDVAKDPYVFALNVNKATYQITNYLLRSGKGISTFAFLAQPILKEYATRRNNIGGMYQDTLSDQEERYKYSKIFDDIYSRYFDLFEKAVGEAKANGATKEDKEDVEAWDAAMKHYKELAAKGKKSKESEEESDKEDDKAENKFGPTKKSKYNHYYAKALTYQYAKQMLTIGQTLKEDPNTTSVKSSDKANYYLHQLVTLDTFNKLNPYAKSLSAMISCSQIDTKKQGNTLTANIDYYNKMQHLKYMDPNFMLVGKDEEFYKKYSLAYKKEAESEKPNRAKLAKMRSQIAIDYYFNKLFLNDKTKKAIMYSKELLQSQLFAASPLYKDVYTKIMQQLFNSFESEDICSSDEESIPVSGYTAIASEKDLKQISQAIDNIMRYCALSRSGYNIITDKRYAKEYPNMIDFTFGGSEIDAVYYYKDLLFGNDKQKSIFERVAKIIQDIRSGEAKYSDLGNKEDGVTNELLKYLNPQVATKPGELGKMLLQHSQTDNRDTDEEKLVTAFYQLFQHQEEEVKQLAKDLAIFAYYSTFDQNVGNSFFHLVPFEYRAQYDLTLALATSGLSSGRISLLNKKKTSAKQYREFLADDILDKMVRNYWYYDKLVPKYVKSNRQTSSLVNKEGVDIEGGNVGNGFVQYIITHRYLKNPYISVKSKMGNGELVTILYKKVGTYSRVNKDTKKTETFDIFIPVQRAGRNIKGRMFFEYYVGDNAPSLFEENKLPKSVSETRVREVLQEMVDSITDNDQFENLTLNWNSEDIPVARQVTTEDIYEDTSYNMSVNSDDLPNVGRTTLKRAAGPTYKIMYNSDILIHIVNNTTEESRELPKVQSFKETTPVERIITLNADGLNNEEQLEKLRTYVQEVLASRSEEEGNKIQIGIISPGSDRYATDVSSEVDSAYNDRLNEIKILYQDGSKKQKTELNRLNDDKEKGYIAADIAVLKMKDVLANQIFGSIQELLSSGQKFSLNSTIEALTRTLGVNVVRSLDSLISAYEKENNAEIYNSTTYVKDTMQYKKAVHAFAKLEKPSENESSENTADPTGGAPVQNADIVDESVDPKTDKEEKPEDTSEEHKACAVGGGTAKKKSSNESKPKESQDTTQDSAGKSGFASAITMDADIDL